MAHHKRRRPKNRRSGCLLCKPWKVNGGSRRDAPRPTNGLRTSQFRATTREFVDAAVAEYGTLAKTS